MKLPKSKALVLIGAVLSLSACGGLQSGNKNELSDYQPALISRENFVLLNNQAIIDEENSFSTSFD
jgi:hypothetical protein